MGNHATVTITGNLTADPQVHDFDSGSRKARFSVACTPSTRDKETGGYRDLSTTFYDVDCWNHLAQNVMSSLHKGDPVIGGQRQKVVVTASTVGHDLSRGTAQFRRPQREEPSEVGQEQMQREGVPA